MLTSTIVKKAALEAGADICGIGDMARFEGAPKEMDPREIFPEAKTVIGMVFRIPRGVQRGIEEGTQFYQYPSMAYAGINEMHAPAVLYKVGKVTLDKTGFFHAHRSWTDQWFTDHLYVPGGDNDYIAYISLKCVGPAYVKDSHDKTSAIYSDRVLLVREK